MTSARKNPQRGWPPKYLMLQNSKRLKGLKSPQKKKGEVQHQNNWTLPKTNLEAQSHIKTSSKLIANKLQI